MDIEFASSAQMVISSGCREADFVLRETPRRMTTDDERRQITRPRAKHSVAVAVSARDYKRLTRWVLQCNIVLLLSEQLPAREVARRLKTNRHTVALWRSRYEQGGCNALIVEKEGRGRKRARA